MKGISAVVIVRNEEFNIEACLESIKWVSEIIVIDQASTDKTVELAKKYTNNIHITANKNICNPDREFGSEIATEDWILIIEADERVSPELQAEMSAIVAADGPMDIYFMPVKTYFNGKWIRSCGWYPAYIPRLFKKGKIKFGAGIHTNGLFISNNTARLISPLNHYSYNSLNDWIAKFMRYTTQRAGEDFASGKRPGIKNTIMSLLLRPPYYFLRKYIIQKGFTDGWRGLFISMSSPMTIIMEYFKLVELSDKNDTSK
jgi:glycosyltransferase involved in cell wall biosynthesis